MPNDDSDMGFFARALSPEAEPVDVVAPAEELAVDDRCKGMGDLLGIGNGKGSGTGGPVEGKGTPLDRGNTGR